MAEMRTSQAVHGPSLSIKITIAYSVLILMVAGALAISLYRQLSAAQQQAAHNRLLDIVSLAAPVVDGDFHSRLVSPQDEQGTTFHAVFLQLKVIQETSDVIRRVYTLRPQADGSLIHVVDTDSDSAKRKQIGQPYRPPGARLRPDIANIQQRPVVDKSFYADELGLVLVGYAPIYDQLKDLDGILVIEMDASDVAESERQAVQVALRVFLAAVALASLMGWLLARHLTSPVLDLVAAAQRVAQGWLDLPVQVHSSDELGALAESFNTMQSNLRRSRLELENYTRTLEQRVARRTAELERYAMQLRTSSEVGQQVTSILDLDELLNQIVRLIQTRFEYYYVSVWLFSAERDRVILRAGAGPAGLDVEPNFAIAIDQPSLIVSTCKTALFRLANDVSQSPDYLEALPDTRAELALPLRSGGTVLGALDIQSAQRDAFSEQDVTLLQTMAGQVATAIGNARLFEAEKQQRQLADALREALAALTATLDTNLVLDRLLEQVSRMVPNDAVNVMLIEGEYACVVRGRGYEHFPNDISSMRLLIADTPTLRTMLEKRQPVIVPDTRADPTWRAEIPWIRSRVAVPICARGQVAGFLNVDSAAPGFFGPADAEKLRTFADGAAIALENARLFGQVQRRMTELGTLTDIGKALASTLRVDELMQLIYEQTRRVMYAENMFVALYDAASHEVEFAFSHNPEEQEQGTRLSADVGMIGHIVKHRQSLLRQADQVSLRQAGIDLVGPPAACWLGVPMLVGERVLGVISVQHYTDFHAYDESHQALLEAIAGQAAIALENAHLYTEARQRITELSSLNEIGQALSSALNLDELLEKVYHQVSRIFDTTNFFIAVYEQGSDEWTMAFSLENGQRQTPVRRKLGAGVTGHIIRSRQSVLIRNAADRAAFYEKYPVTRVGNPSKSWMGVPLIAADRVVGVMAIQSYEQENLYSQQDLDLFATIGAQVAIAMDNARLYTEARQRITELSILNEISRALSQALNLNELLRIVYQQVGRVFDTTNFFIATYQEGSDEWTRAFQVERGEPQPVVRRKLQIGLTGYILRNRRPVLLRSSAENVAFKENWHVSTVGEQAKSWMGVPLIAADKVVGAMATQSYEQENLYDEQNLALFVTIGAQVAIAIDNAQLFAELQRKTARLQTAAQVSRVATSILHRDELLPGVVELICERFGLYYAGLFLVDESGQWAVLRAGAGLAGRKLIEAGHRLEVGGASMIGWCVARGQGRITLDVGQEAVRFSNPLLPETRSELALPLISRGRVIGAMSVQSVHPMAFSDEDIATLQTMADQVANAIENARLFEQAQQEITERKRAQAAEQQALRREMNLARNIQQSLLPQSAPNIPGVDLAGVCMPAREVGGDLYGYYRLPQTTQNPNGGYVFAVGDVSSKGVPGALYMAVSATMLAAKAPFMPDVAQLLAEMNVALYSYMSPNQMNTALCCARLEPGQAGGYVMHIANAGLVAPILQRGAHCEYLDVRGLPLGALLDGVFYNVISQPMQLGDVLVLSSDGIVEAMNSAGEMYGFDRLLARVSSAPRGSAREIQEWILADVDAFVGEVEPHDDLTLMVVVMGNFNTVAQD